MVSSTASTVDSARPTRFRYRQLGTMLWGTYSGDTVSLGRFVGKRVGGEIRISFAHTLAVSGETIVGSATSRVEVADDGRLSLIEDFLKDGVNETSVCVQAEPVAAPANVEDFEVKDFE